MTPLEQELAWQKGFAQELKAKLAERSRVMLATEVEVLAQLAAARARVLALLATQPEDWQQLQLKRVLAQLEEILDGASDAMATRLGVGQERLWQLGEDAVDKPFGAAGVSLELQLGVLNPQVLVALKGFGESRIKDVGLEAMRVIRGELDLAVLGVKTPYEAMRAVAASLSKEAAGGGVVSAKSAMRRAQTIVRTETARVFAVAQQARLVQAATVSERVGKRWVQSGKLAARWNHVLADGQKREAGEMFELAGGRPGSGVVKMLHPHDPQAPAGETINCGCMAVAHLWGVGEVRGERGERGERGGGGVGVGGAPLANAAQAEGVLDKLTRYSLNERHPTGVHKARVIASALGYTSGNAQALADAIAAALPTAPAELTQVGEHGKRFKVLLELVGPKGAATLQTGWLYAPGSDKPRLVTAFVVGKKPDPKLPGGAA